MTTARDILTLAFFDAGIYGTGQTPSAQDLNFGLTRLNEMMSQWSRNRWLVYTLQELSVACTGAQTYTIGPGGNINTDRPDRIETAFIRQVNPPAPNQVDYPCIIVPSRENYSQIAMKQLGSFTWYLYYSPDYPQGTLYPWPLPSNLYELHVVVKVLLQQFANLTTAYAMPEVYLRAIRLSLQEELLSAYKLPLDQNIVKMAAGARDTIRNANAQIPTLMMPPDLARPGLYNIFSDQSY